MFRPIPIKAAYALKYRTSAERASRHVLLNRTDVLFRLRLEYELAADARTLPFGALLWNCRAAAS